MKIEENVSLAPLTTLHIGGRARFFADAAHESDLLEALEFGRTHELRIAVIGGGSNLLVPDAGYDGLVVRVGIGSAVQTEAAGGKRLLRVDAGVGWDEFVLEACRLGLSGVECLAGIPGLTGASPVQNIGAYGQEVASTLQTVRALNLDTMSFVELTAAECGFSYRHSIFNSSARGRYIITRVDFLLGAEKPNLSYADLGPLREKDVTPIDVYHFVREVRARKGMLIEAAQANPDMRSAGSFFRNPVVESGLAEQIAAEAAARGQRLPSWPAADGKVKLAAASLVENAGFPKGFALGGAGISTRHALALVNRTGNASAAELFELRDRIVAGVQQKFGVTLEQEPVTLG